MRRDQLWLTGLAVLAVVGTAGCLQQSAPARAQEAAQDLNMNARFGRMELAMEHVAGAAREDFARRHKAWGTQARIADSELAGFRMIGKNEAMVVVKVAWYRPDEQELRVTTLRQRYKDQKGDWQLVEEHHVDGEMGLLGEHVVPVAPAEPSKHAQFPTVRIGAPE